jgi:hypothetical protein
MGLMDKAKDVAKKAGDVAQKGLEEAKDKGQELTLRRKLNSLAEELGHVVYRQRDGESGLDGEVERIVSEMRGVRAEIDALEE